MKLAISLVLAFLILFMLPANARADSSVVSSSAILKRPISEENDFDLRVIKLKSFFSIYNSPLINHAESFVRFADLYSIDYRLVPAISGVESTFGKRIPQNSFNAYGWANGVYKFKSWEDSIEIVSKTLRTKYYDKGATNINRIARRYAPPSDSWAWKVKFFMEKIDPTPVEFDL